MELDTVESGIACLIKSNNLSVIKLLLENNTLSPNIVMNEMKKYYDSFQGYKFSYIRFTIKLVTLFRSMISFLLKNVLESSSSIDIITILVIILYLKL